MLSNAAPPQTILCAITRLHVFTLTTMLLKHIIIVVYSLVQIICLSQISKMYNGKTSHTFLQVVNSLM